jgi:hypothetical protein
MSWFRSLLTELILRYDCKRDLFSEVFELKPTVDSDQFDGVNRTADEGARSGGGVCHSDRSVPPCRDY